MNAILRDEKRQLSISQYYSLYDVAKKMLCVLLVGFSIRCTENILAYSNSGLPYSMYDNVINSQCYRFIMYFSNLILYVYYKSVSDFSFSDKAHCIFFLLFFIKLPCPLLLP